MNNSAIVSVIIPTLNRGELLRRAVASVANQTYQSVEIVIVDDCADNPVRVDEYATEAAKLKKFTVIRNSKRSGAAYSRNLGVDSCSGAYYCFLDDDDYYFPNKIEVLKKALDASHTLDAVFGKVQLLDKGAPLDLFNMIEPFDKVQNCMVMNVIHNNSTLVRRAVKEKVKFFEQLSRYQDLQYNIELTFKGNVAYVNEIVAVWNVEQRPDKITFDGDPKKLIKDLSALTAVYSYLKKIDNIKASYLSLVKIKIIRMALAAGRYKNAFSEMIEFVRPDMLLGACRALSLRNRIFK